MGLIVKINKAKIGKRMFKKGKWVFGGFECGSKKIFVCDAQDKDKLLTIIEDLGGSSTRVNGSYLFHSAFTQHRQNDIEQNVVIVHLFFSSSK